MGLKYVGRAPDADASVVTKKYVDDRYTLIKVDNPFISGEVTAAGVALTTQSYVDTQDALVAHKAAVDILDANYVPITERAAADGVASIGLDGYIPAGQLPTLQTVRKPVVKNVDTIFISGQREVVTINAKAFRAATLTIADPGFPYQVLAFAIIRGGALNGTAASEWVGTGNYGQITIMRDNDTVFGKTITSGQKELDYFYVLPYGQLNTTPSTYPALTGSCVLDLWIGLYGGTTYHFTSTDLTFYAIAYPAI